MRRSSVSAFSLLLFFAAPALHADTRAALAALEQANISPERRAKIRANLQRR